MKCSKNLTLLQIEFWIDLQSFKWKIKNKIDLWKCSLDEQEWHHALEMSSSEQLTPKERKREHLQNNNKAKSEQLKLNKTYPSISP
jgi:hypothetical protein